MWGMTQCGLRSGWTCRMRNTYYATSTDQNGRDLLFDRPVYATDLREAFHIAIDLAFSACVKEPDVHPTLIICRT